MTSYKLNNEKNGIELYFESYPPLETREALKSAGWRWSKFAGCWYNKQTPGKIDFKPLIDEYARRTWGDSPHMMKYIKKSTCAAFTLENGDIVGIDKPGIKKRFCFHDEGAEYEFFKELHADKEKMRHYFMRENYWKNGKSLKSLENELKEALWGSNDWGGWVHCCTFDKDNPNKDLKKITTILEQMKNFYD